MVVGVHCVVVHKLASLKVSLFPSGVVVVFVVEVAVDALRKSPSS